MRAPASFCGTLGFRPSHGAVSVVGVTPMAQSLDTAGNRVCCSNFTNACFIQLAKTLDSDVNPLCISTWLVLRRCHICAVLQFLKETRWVGQSILILERADAGVDEGIDVDMNEIALYEALE